MSEEYSDMPGEERITHSGELRNDESSNCGDQSDTPYLADQSNGADGALNSSILDASILGTRALDGFDFDAIARRTAQFSNIGDRLLKSYENIADFSDVMSTFYETAPKFAATVIDASHAFKMPDDLLQRINETAARFSESVFRAIDGGSQFSAAIDSIIDSIRPNIEAIGEVLTSIDRDGFWEKSRNAAERWGRHGWVILENMSVNVIFNCPDSCTDANRLCHKYAKELLPELRTSLPSKVRKSKDAQEMFELYDEGHLKSCAMMACSLIDGELFNWKIAKTRNRHIRSTPVGLVTASETAAQSAAIDLISIVEVYNHFFQSGRGFDRSLEGELNRNFLMHGMMNKRVTKTACLKLFLLLDKLTGLLPLCEIAVGTR